MSARFNPPPGWPVPPPGWEPEPGWLPDASWPPPPPGWQFWIDPSDDALPLPDHLRYQPWAPPEPGALRAGSVTRAEMFGWGGLAVMTVVGAVSSGFSGALIWSGLYAFVVAVVALFRGQVSWARVPSRAVGGAVATAAVVALAVGGATASPAVQADDAPAAAAAASSSTPVSTSVSTSTTTTPTAPPSTDPVTLALAGAADGTALHALADLRITDDASTAGYAAARFGRAWADTDGNGCDQRNDVLRRDLVRKTLRPGGCVVVTGTLRDPYSNRTAARKDVVVDHVVSLRDAWAKGARDWNASRRNRFANDVENLGGTTRSSLDAKAEDDAASWLPSSPSSACAYVARQVAVKTQYRLAVSTAERQAMAGALSACADDPLPPAQAIELGGAPIVKPRPRATHTVIAAAKPKPRPRATHTTSRQSGVHPGAFCAPEGAFGTTSKGTLMRCTSKAGDQARWRAAA